MAVQDSAQEKRTDITRHEKLLLKLLARYSEPSQSSRLRALLSTSSSAADWTGTGSGAVPPEFEFDGDSAEDLMDDILRNCLATLVLKTLKDSAPGPALPASAAAKTASPGAAAAAAAGAVVPPRARRVVLLGPSLMQEDKSEGTPSGTMRLFFCAYTRSCDA